MRRVVRLREVVVQECGIMLPMGSGIGKRFSLPAAYSL
jgi:hypothetical protein